MPADKRIILPFGTGGLNLRDSPTELGASELADALNFRIDQTGALVKRLAMVNWSAFAPAAVLELMQLATSSATFILIHCADGHVYKTSDGTTWTSIDSGISTTTRVGWVQYLGKLYYCDGTNDWRSWDGTTLTTSATMIKSRYATIWRNRLWVIGMGANARTVYWSLAGTPTDFTTYALNTVSFPDGTDLTAITTAPNVGQADGSDGVLVFTNQQVHRIYDDTDNVSGAVIGGANVLVDGATGCLSHRSVVHSHGRVYFLSRDGVFSTDGHAQAREESVRIAPLFPTMAWSRAQDFVGVETIDGYLLAYAPVTGAANTRVLELFLNLPASAGQHPWMAHDLAVRGWLRVATVIGDVIYAASAVPGEEAFVRQYGVGGADAASDQDDAAITCFARTGAQLLGINGIKRLRRIELFGKGAVTIAVSKDLEEASGETGFFDMRSVVRLWDVLDQWGVGEWGGGGDPKAETAWYQARGRYFTFELSESSTDSYPRRRALGYAGGDDGGAAAYSMVLKVTPLDAD